MTTNQEVTPKARIFTSYAAIWRKVSETTGKVFLSGVCNGNNFLGFWNERGHYDLLVEKEKGSGKFDEKVGELEKVQDNWIGNIAQKEVKLVPNMDKKKGEAKESAPDMFFVPNHPAPEELF